MTRIRLKPVNSEDLIILYNWFRNESDMESFTCQPLQNLKESFEEYRIRKEAQYQSDKSIEMLVSEEGKPVGKLSCFNINSRNKSAEVGYYFPREHRGNGYGSWALKLFLNHLFVQNDFNKIYATTSSSNIASIKVLEKLNFTLDGRNREHYWIGSERYDQLVYSLLQREWEGSME